MVRAGLWEREVRLLPFEGVDLARVYELAQEQSVVGLVGAGLEHVLDVKVPQEVALSFACVTLQLEHRNKAMNAFVADLMLKLRVAGVNALLVKGQGIAQCYERPLWRAAGDVDLLVKASDYEKAKEVLSALSDKIVDEMTDRMHLEMKIGLLEVELHGTLRADIGHRIDLVIDSVQEDTFRHWRIRTWRYGDCFALC